MDTGIFYDLKGSVSDNGTTMTGSFTSNCSSDHGTFTGSLYAPVNKTYIGIVNGSNDDGTVTQYNATLVLTEDAQFNVTGSILLNTPSGTATCYGTIQLNGPATGDFIELGGTNANVQMLELLVIADKADFSSVSVQTLEIASLAFRVEECCIDRLSRHALSQRTRGVNMTTVHLGLVKGGIKGVDPS